MENQKEKLRERLQAILETRYLPDANDPLWMRIETSCGLDEVLEHMEQGYRMAQSESADRIKALLVRAARYGYDYRDTTQFPDLSFDDNCKNNFLQASENWI